MVAATVGLVLGACLSVALRPLDPEQFRFDGCGVALDRQGRTIGPLRASCEWAPLVEVAPSFAKILVAVEDRRFWDHYGVDPVAIIAALRERRASPRGASTLSMQVVRELGLVPRERSLARKLRELALALRLERTVPKSTVLELYVNRSALGRNLVGVAAASRAYFARPPRDLSFAESALLVSLLPAPSSLDPRFNLSAACARRDQVLARLQADPMLGAEARAALLEPCALRQATLRPVAPHALALLRRDFASQTMLTTLDLEVQAIVEFAMSAGEASIRGAGLRQAAVVVLDSRTSEIRALTGSFDFDEARDGQLNGAMLPRQAGSALKPLLYVEALQTGFDLETFIDDAPAEFREGETARFAPQNADGLFLGRITLREALARSRNVPAVRLAQAVTPARFAAVLSNFGLSPLRHGPAWYGLGIALGTAEVRLLELTAAYATLARHCAQLPPTFVPTGAPAKRVAAPDACRAVVETLQDEAARVRGFGNAGRLGFLEPVGIKTGTSSGARDLWLFATTERFTVGIWAGNFDMTAAHEDAVAMEVLAPVAQKLLVELGVR